MEHERVPSAKGLTVTGQNISDIFRYLAPILNIVSEHYGIIRASQSERAAAVAVLPIDERQGYYCSVADIRRSPSKVLGTLESSEGTAA